MKISWSQSKRYSQVRTSTQCPLIRINQRPNYQYGWLSVGATPKGLCRISYPAICEENPANILTTSFCSVPDFKDPDIAGWLAEQLAVWPMLEAWLMSFSSWLMDVGCRGLGSLLSIVGLPLDGRGLLRLQSPQSSKYQKSNCRSNTAMLPEIYSCHQKRRAQPQEVSLAATSEIRLAWMTWRFPISKHSWSESSSRWFCAPQWNGAAYSQLCT